MKALPALALYLLVLELLMAVEYSVLIFVEVYDSFAFASGRFCPQDFCSFFSGSESSMEATSWYRVMATLVQRRRRCLETSVVRCQRCVLHVRCAVLQPAASL